MGIHSLKRTKVLYGAVALLLFGSLGSWVQITESANTVGKVAPALAEACKDSKFHAQHVEACGTATAAIPNPTGTSPGPQEHMYVSDISAIQTVNR